MPNKNLARSAEVSAAHAGKAALAAWTACSTSAEFESGTEWKTLKNDQSLVKRIVDKAGARTFLLAGLTTLMRLPLEVAVH